ncbi:MAG: thiamine phosphate synthase [Pseudomonadota bacterium]
MTATQTASDVRPRLFLITPFDTIDDDATGKLGAALSGGDVASVLIDPERLPADKAQTVTKELVRICQASDVAALVRNDTQLAGRAGADGVHVDTGTADLEAAMASFQPSRIVGAGRVANRHDALLIGETDVDYVLFGRLDRADGGSEDPDGLALAEWWSPIVEIPCVALAGESEHSVQTACETGAEFIGIRGFVWNNHDGPADAVRKANDILDQFADE